MYTNSIRRRSAHLCARTSFSYIFYVAMCIYIYIRLSTERLFEEPRSLRMLNGKIFVSPYSRPCAILACRLILMISDIPIYICEFVLGAETKYSKLQYNDSRFNREHNTDINIVWNDKKKNRCILSPALLFTGDCSISI